MSKRELATTVLEKHNTYGRDSSRPGRGARKLGKADLHMHSTYSDGTATVEQILHHVQYNTQLDVIAITDHDVIEGALRARDLCARGPYHFGLIVGEEITTSEGHLLALFIETPIQPDLSMERSIDLVHEQGGLAIVPHPFHPFFRHSCQRDVLERIHTASDLWLDGIETWNAGFSGIYTNRITANVNRKAYGWPEIGNSDAHTLSAIESGCTWFEGKSVNDLRAAIEAGLTIADGRLWRIDDYLQLAHYRLNASAIARILKLDVAHA